jgi:E3 ubiquitin-protein ligase UBR1
MDVAPASTQPRPPGIAYARALQTLASLRHFDGLRVGAAQAALLGRVVAALLQGSPLPAAPPAGPFAPGNNVGCPLDASAAAAEQASTAPSSGAAASGGGHHGACGHIFKNGEGIYRCAGCSTDNPVVLCSACFHASVHATHANVSFSVSRGGGGCCDCGDEEAWTSREAAHCSLDSSSSTSQRTHPADGDEQDSEEATERRRDVVAAVLDLCLIVSGLQSRFRASLPSASASLADDTRFYCDYDPYAELARVVQSLLAHIPSSALDVAAWPGDQDETSGYYATVLYNDSVNSFEGAIAGISHATRMSRFDAKETARNVDEKVMLNLLNFPFFPSSSVFPVF